MVTQRSAESEESRKEAASVNPALALPALDPWACRHETCFASQPLVTCSLSYLLFCIMPFRRTGTDSCPCVWMGKSRTKRE